MKLDQIEMERPSGRLLRVLPINRVEKEPFMEGLDRTMMEMMLPTKPKTEMQSNKTPSVMNWKVLSLSPDPASKRLNRLSRSNRDELA